MTHVGGFGGLLLVLHGKQTALQHAQRGRAVLDLALLVLHVHRDAGRDVGHAHRGIRGVHGLASRAGAHEDVDLQVLRIDFDLIVVVIGLGEHDHTGGGRLDASLRFGDGDALHAVHTALVLERRPHTVLRRRSALGTNRQLHILDTAQFGGVLALQRHRPAALFRIPHVHAQQIAGEQRGLLAAGAGLDLHDRVARVVGIARNQRGAQLLLDGGKLTFQTLGLLGEIRILGRHFLGGFQIVLHLLVGGVGGDDGAEFGVATTQLAHFVRIRRDLGLGHLLFDITVFLKRGHRRGELFVCQCTPFLSAAVCFSVCIPTEDASPDSARLVNHIRCPGNPDAQQKMPVRSRTGIPCA